MAVESGRLERELEQLLDVERFDPPESFREHALAGDPALYRDADADFEGFWERQAAELDWFEPWSQVLDYCRASMGFEAREQFRILFLDKRNQIKSDGAGLLHLVGFDLVAGGGEAGAGAVGDSRRARAQSPLRRPLTEPSRYRDDQADRVVGQESRHRGA